MHVEQPGPMWANMSAPPRSIVTLPRLSPVTVAPADIGQADGQGSTTTRAIPAGPGGGKQQSGALCLARIELGAALETVLAKGFDRKSLTQPLALVRQLLSLARERAQATDPAAPALPALQDMDEAALLAELTGQLGHVAWPAWVPAVGFVVSGHKPDEADEGPSTAPEPPPPGVRCPLLAARLITAMRGPVFMRDAAPAFSGLLAPAASFEACELWLPIKPGHARAVPFVATPDSGEQS